MLVQRACMHHHHQLSRFPTFGSESLLLAGGHYMGTLNGLQVAAPAGRPDVDGTIMVPCHQHGATCMHGCSRENECDEQS